MVELKTALSTKVRACASIVDQVFSRDTGELHPESHGVTLTPCEAIPSVHDGEAVRLQYGQAHTAGLPH